MEIANNIIRHYLKNVYFINGTAYAGKSTMCAMLAERFGLIHCEENYGMDEILSIATQDEQPNMNYFNTKKDWQEFLNRAPEAYEAWVDGNSRELAGFEVAKLIRISAERKVIVDTNIPCDLLKQIASYRQVAIMLSPQAMSVDRFFDREDAEKQFLLSEIRKSSDPERTLENFRACIARINSRERCEAWQNSGFFTLVREDTEADTREEVLAKLAAHFGFTAEGSRIL